MGEGPLGAFVTHCNISCSVYFFFFLSPDIAMNLRPSICPFRVRSIT